MKHFSEEEMCQSEFDNLNKASSTMTEKEICSTFEDNFIIPPDSAENQNEKSACLSGITDVSFYTTPPIVLKPNT
jgi:hypothetical protein